MNFRIIALAQFAKQNKIDIYPTTKKYSGAEFFKPKIINSVY